MMTEFLIKVYLDNCTNDTRSQLIFTTHDVDLIDGDLLRPDEIWLTERGYNNQSTMYALSDFKDVKPKDLKKRYLQGRFGGVPNLIPSVRFKDADVEEDKEDGQEA
jgi:AAA15 family ATPase/GTPase